MTDPTPRPPHRPWTAPDGKPSPEPPPTVPFAAPFTTPPFTTPPSTTPPFTAYGTLHTAAVPTRIWPSSRALVTVVAGVVVLVLFGVFWALTRVAGIAGTDTDANPATDFTAPLLSVPPPPADEHPPADAEASRAEIDAAYQMAFSPSATPEQWLGAVHAPQAVGDRLRTLATRCGGSHPVIDELHFTSPNRAEMVFHFVGSPVVGAEDVRFSGVAERIDDHWMMAGETIRKVYAIVSPVCENLPPQRQEDKGIPGEG